MTLFNPAKNVSGFLLSLLLCYGNLAHADDRRDCTSTLETFSWVFDETPKNYPLKSEDAGAALHGVSCREGEIIAWFESNSWILLRATSVDGEAFGSGAQQYRGDRALVFCQPRPRLLRWLGNKCAGQTSVLMFEGEITQIFSGPTK